MNKAIMRDLLIEIGTEELPPKDLTNLAHNFTQGLAEQFKNQKINFKLIKQFATPRRLAVIVSDLQEMQSTDIIEKKGPSKKDAFDVNGNPTKALLGFANSCNVSIDELKIKNTDKGEWVFFEKTLNGQATVKLLSEIIHKVILQLPINKKMRWSNETIEFVRPVHWLIVLFGSELIPIELFGIKSDRITFGHRFHYNKAIIIKNPEQYEEKLFNLGKVVANFDKRKNIIRQQIQHQQGQLQGIALVDEDLLDIVTGLVEWPVALLASFDKKFLQIPKPCLISAMQNHQKCFAVLDKNGSLLPNFIIISNIESIDVKIVINGNEKVMYARLSDADFYYNADKNRSLESYLEVLKNVIFQEKLGSLFDKTNRIRELAAFIAKKINADVLMVDRAALLCKADLMSNMVYEFPELQGVMGEIYASLQGENKEVARAIFEHYKPNFAHDNLPETLTGICLAIADRIDSLVGLFSIGQTPIKDKDPFALRRQALAILRILFDLYFFLDLQELFTIALQLYEKSNFLIIKEIWSFCLDRLRSWYSGKNINNKIIEAVLAVKTTIPYDIHQRLLAVIEFQTLPEASDLAIANKRVQKLLSQNYKNNDDYNINNLEVDQNLFDNLAEKELFLAIINKENIINKMLLTGQYAASLTILAQLRNPIDKFFSEVMVMADDQRVKKNRLNLLSRIRKLFLKVADISLL